MRAEPPPETLHLGLSGFRWEDLQRPERLRDLHDRFWEELGEREPAAAAQFAPWRQRAGAGGSPTELSDALVALAPHVGAFVARLFGVSAEREDLIARTHETSPIFRMKDQLVKRRALKRPPEGADPALERSAASLLEAGGVGDPRDELAVSRFAVELLEAEGEIQGKSPASGAAARVAEKLGRAGDLAALSHPAAPGGSAETIARALETLERWLLQRRRDPAFAGWVSFRHAHPVDHRQLVQVERFRSDLPEEISGPLARRRRREGFALTDPRMSRLEVLDQVDYCLYCHDRDKDSCSKGLREKDGSVRKNPLGVPLDGCPLDEKISEAHLLMKGGDAIAALALICIDNPMLPGTGHRICNDCMKACIFQKQEPVDIPQIETGILSTVLAMPWGFEIYDLLTRWNPLRPARPFPLPYHGHDVLVVGLGPAGYTLAHHLLNEGFGVVGIDGLKLEPPPAAALAGPVRDLRALTEELDRRVLLGFGGVSEYGITVRWDKNFLAIIYAVLSRRERFRAHGGVRFGGTLRLADAWELGFHHVAIAAGAGKPTIVELERNLIRGIRQASDFLMALQLSGAAKRDALANLQVRLPGVVIGGGLTAIDSATELRAYYVVQVEKILERHEILAAELGDAAARAGFDREEQFILDEFLAHGRAIRAERESAAREGRAPAIDRLLDQWGGVSIIYRKRLTDSPAYRLNHEEVVQCLREGVRFVEGLSPKAAIPDEFGALEGLSFARADGSTVEIPARTALIAAGTSPNTTYEREHPGTFPLDGKGFFLSHQATAGADGRVRLEPGPGFFTGFIDAEGRTVSYYGDNHPRYAGSVVKAMASAKDGYPFVADLFRRRIDAALADPAGAPRREEKWRALAGALDDGLRATVAEVNRLTPSIVEVVVRAPLAARRFRPGQFFRLQNYETRARSLDGTRLLMEGLALTGASADRERGLLSLIVLEMGGSSRLCSALRTDEPVVLMGPTGAPTTIPRGESVLLAGGGLGNAVLFSIARALKENDCRVIYFAGYKRSGDIFKRDEIESSTDQVVWAADVPPAIPIRRPQDRSFVGNIVAAMEAYARGALGEVLVPLREVTRVIAIGSDRMMAAVAAARHGVLAPHLRSDHEGIGSINSPMQCMMKEICAQCLQRHIDPATGKVKEIVFSCFNQDQRLDEVDWGHLRDRLRQNTVQEKLTNLWLDRMIRRHPGLLQV